MKTDIANDLSDHLIAEAKKLDDMAKMYAVQYAESDDKASKAAFEKYAMAAGELRKLHGPLCQVLHALEAMIPSAGSQKGGE